MAKIAVKIRNFEGNYAAINGDHVLEVSRRSILRAAIMVGFQNYDDFAGVSGKRRKHDFLKGEEAVNSMNLQGGALSRDPFFDSLDMSDKGILSYSHGLIFAKLVAERFLGVPWLAPNGVEIKSWKSSRLSQPSKNNILSI